MRVTFFLFLLSGMLLADNKGSEVPVFENALPGVRYVGSEVCAGCHSDVYRSFKKTDMGRSMAVLTASGKAPASQLSLAPTVVTVHSEKLHREFQVFTKGNELFQSEYELAPDGSEVFRDTQKLEYAVGALENAYTYIVKRGGFLYEAPLSYYKSLQAWDLSPGYADVDAGFSRPIATACAACHSGQPRPEKQPPGRFRDPPFTEVAIGCENCHGPGQLHVQARSTGKLMPAGYDRTIVNPQKLPPWLANNICMNCHEAGQSRIMHPGKEATSYRPGTPLDSVVSLFTLAAKQESAGKTDVLSHYQGMTASKCYRASGEKLQCITCHHPHVQSQNQASVYKSKCLSCHQENSCTLPVKSRQATVPADNCVGCHMGKKGVATIPHSALTDHRIVRTPDEALPPPVDDGFTKATGLVHLNAVPGETASELIVLRAYAELAASYPQAGAKWLQLLQKAIQTHPQDPWVLAQAGDYLVSRQNGALAEQGREYLFQAIKEETELPGIYLSLARSLRQAGDAEGAIHVLKQGIAADPSNSGFHRGLIALYMEQHDAANAFGEASRYLEAFPQDDEMRSLLLQLKASVGTK